MTDTMLQVTWPRTGLQPRQSVLASHMQPCSECPAGIFGLGDISCKIRISFQKADLKYLNAEYMT